MYIASKTRTFQIAIKFMIVCTSLFISDVVSNYYDKDEYVLEIRKALLKAQNRLAVKTSNV